MRPQRMKQTDFPTPWQVIRHGRVVAEFDSEASARLYVEVRKLTGATVERSQP
jgi:hypothetical protein